MLRKSILRLSKQRFLSCFRHKAILAPCANLSRFSTQQIETEDTGKPKDPKWMKFFKGMEPIYIDVERAVKSANTDLLHNYVRSNYLGFKFNELTVVLATLSDLSPTNTKLLTEIKMRISAEKHESSKKNTYNFFSKAKDIIIKDDLMKKYVLLEIDKYFETYNHFEQTEALSFMFKAEMLKTDRILQYLAFYEDIIKNNKIQEYFASLTPKVLLGELAIFQNLHKFLTTETFNTLVSRQLLDGIINQLLSILAEPKIMRDHSFSSELEASLPEGTPSFFTPEQEVKYKTYLASNFIYTRYNVDENLGSYILKGRDKNIVKHLSENFGPGDRYLLEKPIFLLYHHLRSKWLQNRFSDIYLLPFLTKFEIIDVSYFESFVDSTIIALRQTLKKKSLDREVLSFVLSRWREVTSLNFDEALKSVDSSEKQSVAFFKSEMASTFEKFLLEPKIINDVLETLVGTLTSVKFQDIQIGEIKTKEDEIALAEKDIQLEGESILEALKAEMKDEKDVEALLGEDFGEQVEDPEKREAARYAMLKEMQPHLIKSYEERLKDTYYFRLFYYDQRLPAESIDAISTYLSIIDAIPRFILFRAATSTLLLGIQKFFSRQEHEIIFDSFVNLPGFIDNLLLTDLLVKDHGEKLGISVESVFPDSLRMKIYQHKRKLDYFYEKYNGNVTDLIQEVESKLLDKVLNTNELNVCTITEAENLLTKRSKMELVFNHNKDKYKKEIEFLKVQESSVKYKFSNCPDISEIYTDSDENFYVRCINSPIFMRMMKKSQLKKVLARVLNKMSIPYHQDYCDFPFVADFLLFPKENQKIIIQVADPDKMILGIENVQTLYTKICDFGFSRHGYKIINFRVQDYDIEEAVIMEKIKAAL